MQPSSPASTLVMRTLQLAFNLLLVVCLCSCVFRDNEPLPKQTPVAPLAGFAAFAGSYRLLATPTGQGNGPPSIGFGFLQASERKAGDVIRLKPEENCIAVRYESSGQVVQTGTLPSGNAQVRFEPGRLILEKPVSNAGAILPGVPISSGQRTILYFADNGDLVIATRTWEAAATLLIAPFYESKQRVYRFRRMAE